ncbi:MAG TPA: hypothetical protein PLP51_03015 [Acholeplasmataceae bacterium]|nr:hypothetical protein [Acholeplasmataceae bacterium]
MNLKYYRVTCKCGHVGKSYYIKIDFPIKAHSRKEAARVAKTIPRVKRNHKDAVLACKEINIDEFKDLISLNDRDPYLKCNSKKEQLKIKNLKSRMIPETKQVNVSKEKQRNLKYKRKMQQLIEKDLDKYLLKEMKLYGLSI